MLLIMSLHFWCSINFCQYLLFFLKRFSKLVWTRVIIENILLKDAHANVWSRKIRKLWIFSMRLTKDCFFGSYFAQVFLQACIMPQHFWHSYSQILSKVIIFKNCISWSWMRKKQWLLGWRLRVFSSARILMSVGIRSLVFYCNFIGEL